MNPQLQEILKDLNTNQKKTVTHGEGPLLIVAGAGTGKTRVITYRIAYLIAKKKALPKEILALTFTEKAASEMSSRVDLLVPYGFNDVWISTFHAFGDRILRENAAILGISPDFKVLTKPEAIVFFREHLFEFPLKNLRPLGNPTWYISFILDTISRAKDEDVSPEDYINWAEKTLKNANSKEEKETAERQLEIAHTYKKYEELKSKYNYVDFGDQVWLTLKLLRSNASVLSKYQNQYKYILIDEFQDTNHSQFEIAKLLAEPLRNIFVVADDDQSIYKFRGACLSNVLGFKKFYKNTKIIVLTENYRSTQIILNTSYRLINHNNPERLEIQQKIKKKLTSARKITGKRPEHLHFDTVYTEADNVAKTIKQKVDNGEYKYRDFAILVRTNDLAQPFLKSLNVMGIPWIFSGAQGFTERKEIKFLVALLRVVANADDSKSLYYLISDSNVFGSVDISIITKLNNLAKTKNRSLFYIMSNIERFLSELELAGNEIITIKSIVEQIKKYIKLSNEISTGRFLYDFLKEKKILDKLARAESLEEIEQAQNIAKFFNLITRFSEISEYDRVINFVDYIELLFEGIRSAGGASEEQLFPELELDYDAVNVITVHKAKGLEFSVVFLVGLTEDNFPVKSRTDPVELPLELIKDILPKGDYHIQEERRLFYVGMTRAKDELYLTSAQYYGGKKPKKISRFVQEALDVPLVDVKTISSSIKEQIERFSPQPEKTQISTYKPQVTELINLSTYAIDDYLTCPLKYKFIHILKIPLPKHHTLVFGETIHKVLKEYHTSIKEGKKITQEELLKLYDKFWIPEGYLSREHEEQRYHNGKEMLLEYYKHQQEEATVPLGVEEEFKFIVDGNIRITGRWDRLDEKDGQRIIIDYKTSAGILDEKDAQEETKKSKQLVIYALGHKEKYRKLPDLVGLYFLGSGIFSSIKIKNKKFDKILEEIHIVAEGIRSGIFDAKPGYYSCEFCPYRSICSKSI